MGLFNVGKKVVTRWNPVAGAANAGVKAVQGDFKGAANDFAAGTTFGATDAAQYGYNKAKEGISTLGDAFASPYTDAAKANEDAASQSEALGQKALDMAGAGINRSLEQTVPATRQWSKTYELGGELAGPGALERRYEDRRSGANPALDHDRKMGQMAIDDAFAARGLQNSGAALKATARLNEGISAENQRQLDGLAAGAQGAQETRLGGAFDRIAGLGNQRAGIVQSGTQGGIDSYTAGQLGGIQGRLAAANNKAQMQKDAIGLGFSIPGMISGLTGGG